MAAVAGTARFALSAALNRSSPATSARRATMQDLIWLAVVAGLLALTLAYVRLCEAA